MHLAYAVLLCGIGGWIRYFVPIDMVQCMRVG